MAFFIAMFCCNLLIPLVMVIGGYFIHKNPPRKINHTFGYRTKMSRINQDTWRFAHQYCGRLWMKVGAVLLIASVLTQLPFARAGEDIIGFGTLILEAVQIAVLLGTIAVVERALKQTFDENGRRRQ